MKTDPSSNVDEWSGPEENENRFKHEPEWNGEYQKTKVLIRGEGENGECATGGKHKQEYQPPQLLPLHDLE